MTINETSRAVRTVSPSLVSETPAGAGTRFVRGVDQLGVYRPEWNQTGHILTKWEAETAYGKNILDEAREYSTAILRETATAAEDALRERRSELGLSVQVVAQAARVDRAYVELAESRASQVPILILEGIASALGLDERFLGFKRDCGGDKDLGYRLKVLQGESTTRPVNQRTAAILAEAASIISTQKRLHDWLELRSDLEKFRPSSDYVSGQYPAWHVGYTLAEQAREILGLKVGPIPSMRELAEKQLGIPVVQANLATSIAGATVTNTNEFDEEVRGIVLNLSGDNQNVWVRRATLAHELGHLLFDPKQELKNVRVDSYADNHRDVQGEPFPDFVEQRANAFAIAFLAPISEVRKLAPDGPSSEAVSMVMSKYGISHTAARYHIKNSCQSNAQFLTSPSRVSPSDEQKALEDFTIDYFPIIDTPPQRRGRFAGVIAAAADKNLISSQTAALYLGCSVHDFKEHRATLPGLYDL